MEDELFPNEQFFEVGPPLNEILSHFYHFRLPLVAEPIVKHLSPNFEMLLVFNFGPPVGVSFNENEFFEQEIRDTAVIGPLRKMLNYKLMPGSDIIVANFHLNGFYRLFKVSLTELAGSSGIFDPDLLIGQKCFSRLWEDLFSLKNLTERIQLLRDYADAFIADNEEEAEGLLSGASYFHNPVIQPVKAIAANTKLSERTIQLRFQKYVGYSPKELLRFLRFKKVVYQLLNERDKKVNLFDLITVHGYHDQSHLIKDFKHFIGMTPKQFIENLKNNQFCVVRSAK